MGAGVASCRWPITMHSIPRAENEALMRPSTASDAGDGIEMGAVKSNVPQMRMSVGGQHMEVIGADGVTIKKSVKRDKASKRQEGSRAMGSRAMGSRAMGSRAMGSIAGQQDPWDARRPSIEDVEEEDAAKPSFQERAGPLCMVCCLFVGLPVVLISIFNWSDVSHVFETGASCTTMTCPTNYLPKDDMSSLRCQESECTPANDVARCCNAKARCSTFACLDGYFDALGKSSIRCAGTTCTEEADLERCCESAGTCPMGLSPGCPENFRVSPRSNGIRCRHVWCEQEECCSATCAGVGCGAGLLEAYLVVDRSTERFCNNPQRCNSNEHSPNSDVPNCCVARCSSKQCPEHFEQLEAEEARSTACETFACDGPSDVETCCREHARCSSFACPEGMVPKTSSAELYCRGIMCDHLGDADECCDNAAAI